MKKIYLLCILLLGLTSCVDEYNADLPSGEMGQLVVDGHIISDTTCIFHLTRTIPINTYPDYRERGAQLSVHGSDGSVWKATESYPQGTYRVRVGHLRNDVQYWIDIQLEDQSTYSSQPAQPVSTPQILYSYRLLPRENEDDVPLVEMRVELPQCRQPMHLRLGYRDAWEIQTPFRSNYVTELLHNPVTGDTMRVFMNHGYGTSRNLRDVFIHTQDFTDCYVRDYPLYSMRVTSPVLSLNYITEVQCQAVSEEEYRYEEARRKQSDEMGGLFTPQPGNLPSNIRCTSNSKLRAMGFVGVRGSVSTAHLRLHPDDVGWYEARRMNYETVDIGSDDDIALSQDRTYRLYHSDVQANKHTWVSRWMVDFTDGSWGGNSFTAPELWNVDIDD